MSSLAMDATDRTAARSLLRIGAVELAHSVEGGDCKKGPKGPILRSSIPRHFQLIAFSPSDISVSRHLSDSERDLVLRAPTSQRL